CWSCVGTAATAGAAGSLPACTGSRCAAEVSAPAARWRSRDSVRPERRPRRQIRRALPVLALVLAGCALSRPPTAVMAPFAQVISGEVLRDSVPADRQLVKLYDQSETTLYDAQHSDSTGHYGFLRGPAGGIMIKATSDDSLDFAYVRYQFVRVSSS